MFNLNIEMVHDEKFIIDMVLSYGTIGDVRYTFPKHITKHINMILNSKYTKFNKSAIKRFIDKCQEISSIYDNYVCIQIPIPVKVYSVEINL
jgi:hypothetical protein